MTLSSTEACFKGEATRFVKSALFLVRCDCISALADGVSALFGSLLATTGIQTGTNMDANVWFGGMGMGKYCNGMGTCGNFNT